MSATADAERCHIVDPDGHGGIALDSCISSLSETLSDGPTTENSRLRRKQALRMFRSGVSEATRQNHLSVVVLA
jgi:hypothetical protein